MLPVVRYDAKAGERSLDLLRWGLIPHWANDIKVGFANINAKAEGIENRLAFRKAFERRRCLVPVDNSYEWKKTATGKQPYAITLADHRIMALAGLWENWHSPAGEWIRTFAVVTTQPNELCAELHNRMPAVLKPEMWPAWLGEKPATVRDLKAMLGPYPPEDMIALAGEHARRQHQEQRSVADRPGDRVLITGARQNAVTILRYLLYHRADDRMSPQSRSFP